MLISIQNFYSYVIPRAHQSLRGCNLWAFIDYFCSTFTPVIRLLKSPAFWGGNTSVR